MFALLFLGRFFRFYSRYQTSYDVIQTSKNVASLIFRIYYANYACHVKWSNGTGRNLENGTPFRQNISISLNVLLLFDQLELIEIAYFSSWNSRTGVFGISHQLRKFSLLFQAKTDYGMFARFFQI